MRSVLVCEDDLDISALVASLLTAAGCRVRTATTVTDGLAAVAADTPDVVVCDLGLPDGTGADVCRAAADAGARVVVMTAVPPAGYPDDLPGWAHTVLRKPFSAIALRDAVTPG